MRYNEIKTNCPKLFAALEEMYYDNNGGGVIPIWESSRARGRVVKFTDAELEVAEAFLAGLNPSELIAFNEGDEDSCEERLGGYTQYAPTKKIMDDFFDGENGIFVSINPFTKKEK